MVNYRSGNLIDFVDEYLEDSPVIIPHITNDINVWGSGFVVALDKAWPESEFGDSAPRVVDSTAGNVLGKVSYALPEDGVVIANMCAQTGIRPMSTGPRSKVVRKPIRYSALVSCMNSVANMAQGITSDEGVRPHILAPKFGSLRAGGNWDFIEELIEEIWIEFPVTVVTYQE